MPTPSRPANISFDISFGKKPKSSSPTPNDEAAPLRIVIIGHFGGRSGDDATAAYTPRPAIRVNCDNFDAVCAQFGGSLRLPSPLETDLHFQCLDDFHPDRLLKTFPSLAVLTDLRERLSNPATAADAAAEVHRILAVKGLSAKLVGTSPKRESQSDEPDADTFARLLGSPNPSPATPPLRRTDVALSTAARDAIVDYFLTQAVSATASAAPSQDQTLLLGQLGAELAARLRHILHHPAFQALESAWRALDFLVREAADSVEIDVLDISREELERQLASGEDHPAATPIGRQIEQIAPFVVLSPWTFGIRDTGVLRQLAVCAAACGTALIAGGAPDLIGCASFASQPDPHDWPAPAGPHAEAFAEVRRAPESAHLGLTAPRFLLRLPYGRESDPIETFPFEELEFPGAADSHECYLWGSSAFLCGRHLINAFAENGWEMELDGTGGEIGGLPVYTFEAADGEKQVKPCAEAWLTERAADRMLSRGLMPVLSVRGSDSAILVSLRSISDSQSPLQFRRG